MRQIVGAAHDRRARADHLRHGVDRRPGRQPGAGQGPRHRHGVPVLRALSAHDGARQSRLRAAAARRSPAPRSSGASQSVAAKLGLDALSRAQAPCAFRRAAAARGARPRDRPRSQGVPVRRAAVQPRCRAARHHAQRADQAAARDRHHDDLRHPRPGRGHDHGRSHLHHERGRGRADRRAARGLSQARPTPSSPAFSATRR